MKDSLRGGGEERKGDAGAVFSLASRAYTWPCAIPKGRESKVFVRGRLAQRKNWKKMDRVDACGLQTDSNALSFEKKKCA